MFAPLERYIAHRYLAALLVLLQGVAVLILIMVPGTTGVLCGVALFGAASGAGTLARPALLAEHYGQAHYGSINGVLAFFLAGAQALAPVGAGALYTGHCTCEDVRTPCAGHVRVRYQVSGSGQP